MGKPLNDFSALKGLKKELEKQEQTMEPKKAPQQTARPKTVQHLTVHEEHARNEGIEKGMHVRLMDTNDEGVITGIGKDFFTVEIDGLPMRLVRSEFIIIDKAEDRRLYAAMPSKVRKDKAPKTAPDNGDLVVDLHMERIPGSERVPEWAALEYQIGYFRKVIRENMRYKGKRIVFIHGDGDGTLRTAIRKELDETFALSCSWNPAPAELYGTGATAVTIR